MRSRPTALCSRVLATALAAAILCAAGPGLADPQGRLRFRSFGSSHGLGNLVVNQLLQGADGLLWVATQDGLYRFDGKRFERFGAAEGLPSTNIRALALGEGRTVWVGTVSGLARWDGLRFRAAGAGLPPGQVNALALRGAEMWVAAGPGLYTEVAAGRFLPTSGWPGGRPEALWADAGGLIAAVGRRLHLRSAGGTWTTCAVEGPGSDAIEAVVRDAGGTIWARSITHLWRRPPDALEFTDASAEVPPAAENGSLGLDHEGALLLPSRAGLARRQAGRWVLMTRKDGLPNDLVQQALEDREGSLWVGGIGLHQLLGRGLWTTFNQAGGLPSDTVWSIHRDRNGTLWVGTANGLVRSAGGGWQALPGTADRSVRTIAEAPDGALWFGGAPAAVVRLGPDGGLTVLDARAGVEGGKILSLRFDREGALWAGTATAGLLRMPAQGPRRFSPVPLPGGAPDERIADVLEDGRGRLWAAGEQGLALLEQGRWRRFTEADGLRDQRTAYVVERRNGELCVVYMEAIGLSCFRPGQGGLGAARHLDTRSGLAGGRVYQVGEDREERLWVGTGSGVSVLGPSGVEQFAEAQGLPGDDTAAMAFLAEESGDVWVGTSAGLGRFDGALHARLQPLPPPRPLLVAASLGERVLDPAAPGATVERADDSLAVRFVPATFLSPGGLERELRLLPLEERWHATAADEARYSALSAGAYTFEVRTRTPATSWAEPARLHFVILPAWWQTAWFRGLALVLGAPAVGALVAWWLRTREARRDRRLRARAEASFRALIESSPDLVVVHRDGRVVYANPAAAALLRRSGPDELIGLEAAALVHPEDRARIARPRAASGDGRAPPVELRLLRSDGTCALVEVFSLAVEFAGEPALLALGRDVTERKQLEARLLVVDRMASLGTLASGVAHEINNPLAYVIANQELIGDELRRLGAAPAPAAVAGLLELLADAKEGAQRVRKIVGGLKVLSRAGAEERRVQALEPLIEQAINLAASELRTRARLVRSFVPVPPVVADASRLSQVFMNLLLNAARAIPEGRVEENEIRVTVRPHDPGWIVVEVRDTGAGIPPEVMGRIFDPFFTTREVGAGPGLGLSICHGIVTGLGGQISVESTPGKGSRFSVLLPAAGEQAAGPQAA